MHSLVERRKTPLFGHKKRADLIVDWSLKSPPGAKAESKVHPSGIRLQGIAQGDTPRVYLYFNPARLKTTMDEALGGLDRLLLIHKGFSVSVSPEGDVCVKLLALPKKLCNLWAGKLSMDRRDILLGMIELGPSGISFYSPSECAVVPEKVQALAIIGGEKKAKELSPRSKAFLLRDAAINLVLKKNGGVRV